MRSSGDVIAFEGLPANMLTGQEIIDEKAQHTACTVEMLDTTKTMDVAIIDECQCLEDPDRGGAWVRALLGVNAATVYCAEDGSATHLIQELAAQCGDEVEIRDYTRLSPLRVSSPVQSVKEVMPGDCVVGFSRKHLFKLKEEIERDANVGKVAMVYGALPPETRREQARLFNDPESEHTVLVATDAVGMGM